MDGLAVEEWTVNPSTDSVTLPLGSDPVLFPCNLTQLWLPVSVNLEKIRMLWNGFSTTFWHL